MNSDKYLRRIGLSDRSILPNEQSLKWMQKQHLINVPFENLDIHWQNPIVLKKQKFYQKIVENKRGGFCYELNGLFNQLLSRIGFLTRIVSARVSNGKGSHGPEYDHLAILANVENEGFLVDVGFGDFIAEPLRFVLDLEQEDENGIYLIKKFDDEYYEVLKKDGQNWNGEYIFKLISRDLSEFTGMCNFHQTNESHFSKGKVCSMMTENGRKTLTDKKFIETNKGQKTETDVESEDRFSEILRNEFGIIK